jgi:hypothetical protein
VDTLHRRWSFRAIFSPAHAAGVFCSRLAEFLENAKPKIQSIFFHFQTFIWHHSFRLQGIPAFIEKETGESRGGNPLLYKPQVGVSHQVGFNNKQININIS